MSLKERVYSILILSSPGSFSSAFSGLLVPSRYAPVHTVTSVSAAKRLLAETSFDFIIVNSPCFSSLKATSTLRFMIRLQNTGFLPFPNRFQNPPSSMP